MLFTTNLTFAEWSRLLEIAKMTAALFDRLNYHSYIVEKAMSLTVFCTVRRRLKAKSRQVSKAERNASKRKK